MIWWGIRTFINDFRKRKLKFAPIAYFSTYHGSISHLPTGYMWSPHLVPKPSDWGALVDVVGFCFLNLGAKYVPSRQFSEWIQRGPMPIYIGFGSMPLEDSRKTTDIILKALKDTGQRGIIDRGWGDLGTFLEVSDNIFLLEDCPHDWLFPQCAAVKLLSIQYQGQDAELGWRYIIKLFASKDPVAEEIRKVYISMAVSFILRERNFIHFEGVLQTWQMVSESIEREALNYLQCSIKSVRDSTAVRSFIKNLKLKVEYKGRRSKQCRWMAPEEDTLKLNADGSIKRDSYGIQIRIWFSDIGSDTQP